MRVCIGTNVASPALLQPRASCRASPIPLSVRHLEGHTLLTLPCHANLTGSHQSQADAPVQVRRPFGQCCTCLVHGPSTTTLFLTQASCCQASRQAPHQSKPDHAGRYASQLLTDHNKPQTNVLVSSTAPSWSSLAAEPLHTALTPLKQA
jgi:hypothetical protein